MIETNQQEVQVQPFPIFLFSLHVNVMRERLSNRNCSLCNAEKFKSITDCGHQTAESTQLMKNLLTFMKVIGFSYGTCRVIYIEEPPRKPNA